MLDGLGSAEVVFFASWGRFRAPKLTLQLWKCWFYCGNSHMFKEIKVFYLKMVLKMVLKVSWVFPGLFLGAFGKIFMGLNRSKKTWFFLGLTWVSFARFLLPTMASGASICFFISFRNLLGPILSSDTDPPTLENIDFTKEILTFLKNQRFRPKDGFESVLGLSRATLGSSWGSLGSSLGPLDRPKRASRFVLEPSWAWFARFLLPKMALGASWGCFWLVLGAPEGLLRLVLGAPEGLLRVEICLTEVSS